jgi:DNA-binding NtrC family response regulator
MRNQTDRSNPADRLRILIVDDDAQFLEGMSMLMRERCDIRVAKSGAQAIDEFRNYSFDAVLLDIGLGSRSMDGLQVLERIHEEDPSVPVIMVTGDTTLQSAREAFKKGAVDYIDKKPEGKELYRRIMHALQERNRIRANESLRRNLSQYVGEMIGESSKMRELRESIRLAARHPLPVLITGETGTGKELVAREIHRLFSPEGPYESLNCALPPAGSFERELFGCEKGAFTDVDKMVGRFESAGEGVVLLDEISEIDSTLQAKLLRIIQEREFQRLGGVKRIPLRAKLLATTNRDLDDSLSKGKLRPDLFYRFSVPAIRVPPLRERAEDIPALVEYFLERKPRELGMPRREMPPGLLAELRAYDWPGNVRQLEKAIEAHTISGADCAAPGRLIGDGREANESANLFRMDYQTAKAAAVKAFQKKYIKVVMDSCGGDLTEAAQRMKITRYGLQKILEQLEM